MQNKPYDAPHNPSREEALSRYRTVETLSEDERAQPSEDRQFVAALERGLRVMRAFSSSRDLLSNGELAKRTGLTKPTVSRLTYTLARLGYLSHASDTGLYRLGAQALVLGNAAVAQLDIRLVAQPLMQELAAYAPVGVLLCARSGLDMICIEMRRSPQVVGLGLDVGDRLPIALTAPGRAYLACLPADKRTLLLAELRKSNQTGWQKVSRGIEKAKKDIDARGFCMTIGDWFPEFNSAAVPLNIESPYGTLTLNIGGFASSLPVALIETDLGPRLVRLARRVERLLRGPKGALEPSVFQD
jgi:DNA-binding IclR family transcriptional regulator